MHGLYVTKGHWIYTYIIISVNRIFWLIWWFFSRTKFYVMWPHTYAIYKPLYFCIYTYICRFFLNAKWYGCNCLTRVFHTKVNSIHCFNLWTKLHEGLLKDGTRRSRTYRWSECTCLFASIHTDQWRTEVQTGEEKQLRTPPWLSSMENKRRTFVREERRSTSRSTVRSSWLPEECREESRSFEVRSKLRRRLLQK